MKCLSCAAKSQTYLCQQCTTDVRNQLLDLPQWLDALTETALGQAKFDTPTVRTRRGPKHLNGENHPLNPFPNQLEDDKHEDMTTNDVDAQRARHKAARWHALATGGINPPAAELLDTITDMLATWIRDIATTNRLPVNKLATPRRMAQWLATHTNHIANHPAADELLDELNQRTREIKHAVDRPNPPRFCGPCPTYIEHNRHCGKLLYAPRRATQVTCTTCHTTHQIEKLATHLATRVDVMRFTSQEILAIMKTLRTPIPERTWSRWRLEGRVKVRGYKHPDNPDGSRGAIRLKRTSNHDEPVYRLAEVRKIQATSIRHSDALTCKKAKSC